MSKYKKLFLLLFVLLIVAVSLMLNSCGYTSSKGELVNNFGGIGRSNSYIEYDEFYKYSVFDESFKTKKEGGAIVAPLALSNQEFYYATTAGTVLLLAKETILWEKELGKDELVNSNMCADKEQNLYAITNNFNIYSYNYNGDLRWKLNICDSIGATTIPTDLLCLSDGIIAGTSDGSLVKVSYNGKIIWKKEYNKSIQRILSADMKENLLLILTNNDYDVPDTLYSINPQGNINWKYSAHTRLIKYPVATKDNIYLTGIRFIDEDLVSIVYALDNNGKLLWEKELSYIPRYLSADDDGFIYINGFQNGLGEQMTKLFKIDNKGKLLWHKSYDFTSPSPVLVGKMSLALFGYTDNTVGLYFLDKENGKLLSINSLSNYDPLMQMPTVRPDGAISYAYFQKVGFVRIDEPWINKILPW